MRVRIVVPAASVGGDAVADFETDIGIVDAAGAQPGEVARADPVRQPPLVRRRNRDVADAHAEYFHAVLVGIEAADLFAERFRDAVTAVWFWIDAMIDLLVALLEPAPLIARRNHNPLPP